MVISYPDGVIEKLRSKGVVFEGDPQPESQAEEAQQSTAPSQASIPAQQTSSIRNIGQIHDQLSEESAEAPNRATRTPPKRPQHDASALGTATKGNALSENSDASPPPTDNESASAPQNPQRDEEADEITPIESKSSFFRKAAKVIFAASLLLGVGHRGRFYTYNHYSELVPSVEQWQSTNHRR